MNFSQHIPISLFLLLSGLISCHNPNQVTYTAPPPRTMPLDSAAAVAGAGRAVWKEPPDSATVSFTVPGDSACPVKIGLYDSGRSLVRVLVDSVYAPGKHRINWHPRDKAGAPLSLGYYYYQLEICGKLSTLKFPYRRERE